MTRYLPIGFLLLGAVALTSCEDGVPGDLPGGGGPVDSVGLLAYQGMWEGAYIGNPPGPAEQWETTFIGFLQGGRMMLLESNGQLWDAAYVPGSGTGIEMSDVNVYGADGRRATRLVATATLNGDGTALELRYNLGGSAGVVTLQFGRNAAIDRGASLDLVSGNWSRGDSSLTLTISNVNGRATLDGSNQAGCQYNADIDLIDAGLNLYAVTDFVVTDGDVGACDLIVLIRETGDDGTVEEVPTPFPFAGDGYSGFATLYPDQNVLRLFVTNNALARSVSFELGRN